VRDYTPEYESYRDDAVAIINGAAIAVAVVGVWTKPVFTGPIALVLALIGYFLTPKARGGTILAVCLITVFALLVLWVDGYSPV
jgi:hypothetical protein